MDINLNEMIELEVRKRVAVELRRLLAMVEGGVLVGEAPSPSPSERGKVTNLVRTELEKGERTFAELWKVVAAAGGNKFALRSALSKGRERGDIDFVDGLYRPKTEKPAGGQPSGRKAK